MLKRVGKRGEGMALPFDAPLSVPNGRVREKRRFATQQFEMARLRALAHGQALNITCESCAGFMDFGFTGCHASVPSLQKLAVYAAEALQALEAALLPRPKKAARGRYAAGRDEARRRCLMLLRAAAA